MSDNLNRLNNLKPLKVEKEIRTIKKDYIDTQSSIWTWINFYWWFREVNSTSRKTWVTIERIEDSNRKSRQHGLTQITTLPHINPQLTISIISYRRIYRVFLSLWQKIFCPVLEYLSWCHVGILSVLINIFYRVVWALDSWLWHLVTP